MAPPLYFFARKQLADVVDAQTDRFRPAALREHGLEETFSDVASVSRQTATNDLVQRGPGGFSGVITTVYPAAGPDPSRPGGDMKRTGFHPDVQTWRRVLSTPGDGRATTHTELWIGIDNEYPPTPEDLLRSDAEIIGDEARPAHGGFAMTLADGRRWRVPVIRRPDALVRSGKPITLLPMDMGWDAAGRYVETLKAQYQALWEDCGAICDLLVDADGRPREGDYEISREDGLKWALRILGVNYRYGRHEQNLLHAIDKTNVFTVLGAAVDMPMVYRLLVEKKTDVRSTAEPATTWPGSTGDSLATDPAAASCS